MPITNNSPYYDYEPWQNDALCSLPENSHLTNNFFSPNAEKRAEAKNLCFACPVRWECVRSALESKTIWGIWGGRDDNELRRALSVNAEGNEIKRTRYPHCPYCASRTAKLKVVVVELENPGRWTTAKEVHCTACGFSWRSRTSANAVDAYFQERQDKRDKREAARLKKKEKLKAKKQAQSRTTRGGRTSRPSQKSTSQD